jgi:hypothetical protein
MPTKMDVWHWYWSQEWAWPIFVVFIATVITLYVLGNKD